MDRQFQVSIGEPPPRIHCASIGRVTVTGGAGLILRLIFANMRLSFAIARIENVLLTAGDTVSGGVARDNTLRTIRS